MLGRRFVRQKCLNGFIVDFFCAELMLAIELDGEVHDSEAARALDAARDARLASNGVRVVRLRNNQVRPDILQQIIASHVVAIDENSKR